MIWCHKSATHSQPLLLAPGPIRPRLCPQTASTQAQTGAAMHEDLSWWRIFHFGKKLSIGNFLAAVQVTKDLGPLLQNKMRYLIVAVRSFWQTGEKNPTDFTSNTSMHWKGKKGFQTDKYSLNYPSFYQILLWQVEERKPKYEKEIEEWRIYSITLHYSTHSPWGCSVVLWIHSVWF